MHTFFFFGLYAARFSPDDKFSDHRVRLKKRFGLLPTQQPPRKYWDSEHFISWRMFKMLSIVVLSFFLAIFLFIDGLHDSYVMMQVLVMFKWQEIDSWNCILPFLVFGMILMLHFQNFVHFMLHVNFSELLIMMKIILLKRKLKF